MHHRMLRLVAALVFAVLPLAASLSPAGADDVSSLLGLVNTLRIGRGAAPLIADPALTLAAQQWSARQATTGTLAHNPNLAAQIPAGWGKLGENVGNGGSLTGIFNALVADPPHLANMVDPAYNLTGIAVVTGRNGTLWVTQDFEARAGSQPVPTPAPPPATTLAPQRTTPPSAPRVSAPPRPVVPTTAAAPATTLPAPIPPPTATIAPTTAIPGPASEPATTTPAISPSAPPARSRVDSKAVSALVANARGDRRRALHLGAVAAAAALGLVVVGVVVRRSIRPS